MPRRHVLLLALLAALAAGPPAHAKQIVGLSACGADGCKRVEPAIGQALHDVGGTAIPAPRPAPHFRLVLRIGAGRRTFGTDRVTYVPSARAIGGEGGWSRLGRGQAAKLAKAVAGRAPLPASALPPAPAPIPVAARTRPASAPPAPDDGGAAAWWILGAGALAILAAAGFIRRSRRRAPRA